MHQESGKIIITVPHGSCPQGSFRACDTRARDSGRLFMEIISEYSDIQKILIENPEFRTLKNDGNRKNSRNTEFRKKIYSELEGFENMMILDVHSFLNSEDSFGLTWDPDSREYVIPKIVFLTTPDYFRIFKGFANQYPEYRISVLLGSPENDIISEAESFGTGGVLVEFNEDRDYLTESMQTEFIRVFSEFIINLLEHGIFKKNKNIQGINEILVILLQIILVVLIILIISYIINELWILFKK